MNPTRRKLLDAAVAVLRDDGLGGASARTVAARAGVNQALVFYHFDTVHGLLAAGALDAVDRSLETYRGELAGVGSVTELLALGRRLHDAERASGNVAVMAQLMAGAQHDDVLAAAAGEAMARWVAVVEDALDRLLADHPLGDLLDVGGLARAVAAGFIGVELYEGADGAAAGRALDAIERLATVVDAAADLNPALRLVVRRRLRAVTSDRPTGGRPPATEE